MWYRLRWPREVTTDQVMQVFRLLAGTAGTPVVIETIGSADGVEHRLAIPVTRAAHVIDQCRASLPGLAAVEMPERSPVAVTAAVTLRLSTRRRPLRVDELTGVSHALLTALAHVRKSERLVLQWVLGRTLPAMPVPTQPYVLGHESWATALLSAPFGGPKPTDAELRSAMRAKQAEPGWRVAGRVGVQAATPSRRRELVRQIYGALLIAESPGVSFHLRRTNPAKLARPERAWLLPLRLNAVELATVSAWPVGVTSDLPVEKTGSRLVAPSRALARSGRVVGEATFPGRECPVALSVGDSLRHLHVIGPTGSGKSTLLMNLIAQDMQAGRAVVVIEPKGDLIADVLARVPAERVDDVVLLDPTDSERPVGLNPLSLRGRSPELVADEVLGLFHSLYAAHWGPRTHDILGASLLTLARTPGMTLATLPLLLTDAGLRRRIVPKVADPIGLAPFWSAYEAWSEAERMAATAPVMNKLRPLLMRPELRAIIGQAKPRFDLREVFTKRKLLLVNLASGQFGPEASALLGALVVSQLWQAILGRSVVEPSRRHPVSVVLDEFQTYLHLPVDLADALAQARGLGASFALAHQFLHQLDPAMRSSVLANAQSRIAFRLANEDARALAAGSGLEPEDFQGLGAFEAYAQLVAGSAVQPWCSIRTLPSSPAISDPQGVRAASRGSYGISRTDIDADLQALLFGGRAGNNDDLAPRRRSGGMS